jgi:hypothetical protein
MKRFKFSGLVALIAAACMIPGGCGDDNTYNTYVLPQLVQIKTSLLPDASQGEAYLATLSAVGGSGVYTWSIPPGGDNDEWLSIDASMGDLSGTTSQLFTVRIIVRCTDAEDPLNYDEAVYWFQVTALVPSLSFVNTDPLPAAGVDQAYSQTIEIAGGLGSYTFTKESGGTNDEWLSIDIATGALTGTPTATGSTEVVIRAVDDANPLDKVQSTFHIEIKTVAITTAAVPGAYIDTAYAQSLVVQGGTAPYTWTFRNGGENYDWLSINATTGELTGTPTVAESGDVVIFVQVQDSVSNADIRMYTFSVAYFNPPEIGDPDLPNAMVDALYSAFVPVSGGNGALKYSITGGSNHDWLSIKVDTGELTGTPDDQDAGAVTVTVHVEEAGNSAAYDDKTMNVTVLGVMITTPSMPDEEVSTAYALGFACTGGSGYYWWSIDTGSSQNYSWMTLDPDTGALSGTTPASVCEVVLAIHLEDSLNASYTHDVVFRFQIINTILTEGFETGLPAGWTGSGDWEVGIRTNTYLGPNAAHDGIRMAATHLQGFFIHYTDPSAWDSNMLTTSQIVLPAITDKIFLVYYQWFQTAPDDGCILEIDDDGTGTTWNDLTPATGYTGAVDSGGLNKQGFTGYGAGDWHRVVVDLSAYQGSTRLLRWNFFANGDTILGVGIYIDDITIYELATGMLPEQAIAPLPPDKSTYAPAEASDYAGNFTLRFDPCMAADTGYEVYAGTDSNAVAAATTLSTEYLGSTAVPSYTDTVGTFSSGNTYFWRVDSVSPTGTTKGVVWSFTTTDRQTVMINECFTYSLTGYYPTYTEIINVGNCHQDVSGWQVEVYSGTLDGTYTFPPGTLLAPGKLLVVAENLARGLGWATGVSHEVHVCPFDFSWVNGTSEGEVVLLDTSGDGVDYMGFNVATSHLPTDLTWSGTLTEGSTANYTFFRTSLLDTDNASDWSSTTLGLATPGLKNIGQ